MAKRVSVIATVRNEQDSIRGLLHSLENQPSLHEIIVVDAASDDATVARVNEFQNKLPLRVESKPCKRGEGRNIGAELATGDVLAFIDGDCAATPGWVEAIGHMVRKDTVVAGQTTFIGRHKANRLPIIVGETDVTWPSCNLAYDAALFGQLGGFDEEMITAEDIDLNVRAVNAGAQIRLVEDAVVLAQTRNSFRSHLRQAYAYGIGRRQLLERHPQLPVASVRQALKGHASPRGIARLAAGWLGYKFGDQS